MLLMFLRGAKFNQEKAQKMLVGNFTMKSEAPEWFLELDAFDPDVQKVLDTGSVVSQYKVNLTPYSTMPYNNNS